MRLAYRNGEERWAEFPTDLLRQAAEKILRVHRGALDHDDLIQEARLAIWKARRRWRKRKGVDWVAFGVTVGKRAMIDALRTLEHTRRKVPNPRIVLTDSELLEGREAS